MKPSPAAPPPAAAGAAAPKEAVGIARLAGYAALVVLIGVSLFLFQNVDMIRDAAATGALGGFAQECEASLARMSGKINVVEAARDRANAHTAEMEAELEKSGELPSNPPDKDAPAPAPAPVPAPAPAP
jgi:hypothetical protein